MSGLSANTSSCGGDASRFFLGVFCSGSGEDESLELATAMVLSEKGGTISSSEGREEREERGEDDALEAILEEVTSLLLVAVLGRGMKCGKSDGLAVWGIAITPSARRLFKKNTRRLSHIRG